MRNIYKYKTDFLALNNPLFFELRSESKEFIEEYRNGILSIFAQADENDPNKAVVEVFQINSEEIRTNIYELIGTLSKKEPGLNKISAYFRTLKDKENFAFLPNLELDTSIRLKIYEALRAKEKGEKIGIDTLKNTSLFDEVLSKYSIGVYGPKRINIGKPEKNKRKCRFCNNSYPAVSFKNKAHAISEALGNKTVMLNEECDECNFKFSKTIESDIILYLSLYRTIFNIKGKDGSKKFVGKNFKLENNGNITFTMQNERKNYENDNYNLSLEPLGLLNSQNLYKCLCKYFISVVDNEYLPFFRETIRWINGELIVKELPKIAQVISYHSFSTQPKIVTYIRKYEDTSIPFAVGEFYFTCKIFVFIVPVFSEKEIDFNHSINYDNFWRTFKHYNAITSWSFEDFSIDIKREFLLDLNFKIKNSDNNVQLD